MKRRIDKYFVIISILLIVFSLISSAEDSIPEKHQYVKYGNKGFELSSSDGNYLMQIEWRGQFRLSYPSDTDPYSLEDFEKETIYLGVNRARMKVGGHSFKPWLKYYLEYELFASNLLDFRLMIEKYPWLKIKVGQWKVQYNRERIISSGKQQTAERSILTRPFTVDRQQGISTYGNIDAGGIANFNYWLSTFMGTGRGSKTNDDGQLMWMGRFQWNFMGRVLKFSGSDIEYHIHFTALIAFAGVTNQSQYTRFSQAGGGQLEGFMESEPGQYRVNQWMQESAGKYKGFSWQQEFHRKEINDRINNSRTILLGNLIQAGYIFSNWFAKGKPVMEAYGRYTFYFPDYSNQVDLNEEFTLGLNYFFAGHRNKLTAETSYLESGDIEDLYSGWRYRLQWDVSF